MEWGPRGSKKYLKGYSWLFLDFSTPWFALGFSYFKPQRYMVTRIRHFWPCLIDCLQSWAKFGFISKKKICDNIKWCHIPYVHMLSKFPTSERKFADRFQKIIILTISFPVLENRTQFSQGFQHSNYNNADLKISINVCFHIKTTPWNFRIVYPKNSPVICQWSF